MWTYSDRNWYGGCPSFSRSGRLCIEVLIPFYRNHSKQKLSNDFFWNWCKDKFGVSPLQQQKNSQLNHNTVVAIFRRLVFIWMSLWTDQNIAAPHSPLVRSVQVAFKDVTSHQVWRLHQVKFGGIDWQIILALNIISVV